MRALLLAISLVTVLLPDSLRAQPEPATPAAASALKPYKVVYSAEYNGMDVKASRELKTLDQGYVIRSNIKGLLGSVSEEEHFHIDAQGYIQPDRYRMRKSFFGVDREEKFDVDPSTRLGVFTRKDKRRELTLLPQHLGPVSYQLQIRRDLEVIAQTVSDTGLSGQTFTYPVFSRGKIRDYRFEILGEEETSTGAGTVSTFKLQRVRDKGKRKTIFWMAPAWNFLIVKIQQQEEDGEQYQMMLERAWVDGASVSGTNSN